ncbi:HAD family acid phosphatase [Pantoea sp. 1.19]|uniref:HAD family acid phosphatase n=1 Tax=Pantoea sp. 1.19 TaxID=1925589 RepID=UPI001F0B4B46|nr:HAD family acid phosphatase [Pantoea sp. 1.19]
MADGAALLMALAGCAPDADRARQQLPQQTVMGLNRFQQSGEYRALALQTFRLATQAFDRAPPPDAKPRAAAVDLGDTLLDNRACSAWQVRSAQPDGNASGSYLTQARQAWPFPARVDVAQHVPRAGDTLFYVSHRDRQEHAAIVANLTQPGFRPSIIPCV